jgi:GDP-L-fucose synthase
MDAYSEKQFMNIGYGSDITIKHLAELIQKIVGHEGEIIWDTSKPNGTPRKLMDSSRIKELGWEPKIELEEGINGVYQAYSGLKIF